MCGSPPARSATASSPSAYSDEFQAAISDRSLREARKAGSTNNIRQQVDPASRLLCARALRLRRALDPLEIQYLGGMVYLETVKACARVRPVDRAGLSDAEFAG